METPQPVPILTATSSKYDPSHRDPFGDFSMQGSTCNSSLIFLVISSNHSTGLRFVAHGVERNGSDAMEETLRRRRVACTLCKRIGLEVCWEIWRMILMRMQSDATSARKRSDRAAI